MKSRTLAASAAAVFALGLGISAAWPLESAGAVASAVLCAALLFAVLVLFGLVLPRFFKQPVQIFIAMVTGVGAGAALDAAGYGQFVLDYLGVFGTLFILLLKMVVIPLVFVSIVNGMAGIGDVRRLGRLGAKTLVYYFSTTAFAVLVGLTCVNLIQPGAGRSELARPLQKTQQEQEAPSLGARIQQEFLPAVIPGTDVSKVPILPIIFSALVLGIALAANGERSEPAARVFSALNEAIMTVIDWVMYLAPIGVFALMAVAVSAMGLGYLATLAKYVLTVVLGLTLHLTFLSCVLVPLLARLSPARFLRGMAPAFELAFSTSSSSATLPVTIECATERMGVSKTVASFMLPLGATVNMDGTALYQAVASLFIAEVYGLSLGLHEQFMIFLTAVIVSVGAAGIPGASVGMMVIVLASAGIPVEGVGIILGVDRFLDMCRTLVNVAGDAVGSVVVARSEGQLSVPAETP